MKTASLPRRQTGFSLLELIGVMAVMGILAGALAPSIFQLVEEAYEDAEHTSLHSLGVALSDYVHREKAIPSASGDGWADALAEYASLPPGRVLRNQKKFKRRFYADRRFLANSNTAFTGYVQNQGLAAQPYSPRIIIVSSLDGEISQSLNTVARFDDVWDQNADAVIVESESVLIERVNLAPAFVRILLSNASSDQVGYSLEGGSQSAVAAATGSGDGSRLIYVINDTRLLLNQGSFPSGTLQRQLLVSTEHSLRYELEGVVWHWESS